MGKKVLKAEHIRDLNDRYIEIHDAIRQFSMLMLAKFKLPVLNNPLHKLSQAYHIGYNFYLGYVEIGSL
jgi:hypothetical protein